MNPATLARMTTLLTLAFTLIAGAQAQSTEFVSRLNARFPATTGSAVAPAFSGFYSVTKGQEVVFVRDDLSVLVTGEVIDLGNGRSLAAALRDANRPKLAISDLPLGDAIRFGSGSRKLFVFSDPDCPYCRELEPELAKLTDVSVYVFPLPLTQLHPGAGLVAEAIWCQKDRAAAWRQYMLKREAPKGGGCANPIERNAALGEKYQIRATPTLVFADGSIVPGKLSADSIEGRLAAINSTTAVAQRNETPNGAAR